MSEHRKITGMAIPIRQLPPGFLDNLSVPAGEPVAARPAATTALLRDGAAGLEVLLLQRHRRSGFVPGAYVFPGGRVDPADADERLVARADGLSASEPPPAFWLAAVRELYEETGVLLARTPAGGPPPDPHTDPVLLAARQALLDDRATLAELTRAAGLRPDLSGMVYFGHWITPLVEPRRFDTRFFLAALPAGQHAVHDAREMSDAVWLTPAAALERFRAGTLPMVFPTVHSLELLAECASVQQALDTYRDRPVQTVLPRLVRGPDSVELIIDPEVP